MNPLEIAILRSVVGGFIMAGASFFGQLGTGQSLRTAGISAGIAFFTYLIVRGGAEGLIDATKSTPLQGPGAWQIAPGRRSLGMGLIGRIVLAVVVGVVVYLVCLLVGPLVMGLHASFAVTVGGWLVTYAAVLGLLAALWYFFAGGGIAWPRRQP